MAAIRTPRLAALAGSGDIVDDGTAVALTTAGDARYRALEAKVVEVVSSLYAGIDPRDMDTTKRVLAEITDRATRAQLSATPP